MQSNVLSGITLWAAIAGSIFISPVLWDALDPVITQALAERYEPKVAEWLRLGLYWLNFALVYSVLRASLTLAFSAICLYGAGRYFALV